MDSLYGNSIVTLSSDDKKRFNRVSKAFNDTAEWLHRKKAFTPEMLSEPEPLALISATHDVLAEELGRLERRIPDEMARALDENIFLFSGFKTYHELNDASRLLKDDDGGFKSFDRFLQDVKAIDAQYNQNYLYAEYNFATASTQMTAKWADIERDGDEYDLQYRTAMDGLVRPEHAALEGITLPPSDKFWNEYYPPNGWNCRCTAVQVLKDKYPTSDSDQACAAGERATTQIGKNGENKAAMFRFNPGKAGKVFPPKHPYYKAPAEAKKKVNVIVATMMTVTEDNSRPPHLETYDQDKDNKHVFVSQLNKEAELKENVRLAKFLAGKTNEDLYVLPHIHPTAKNAAKLRKEYFPDGVKEDKNPDYFFRKRFVDGKSANDIEISNVKSLKRKIQKRLGEAFEQADDILIEIPTTISITVIKDAINGKLNSSKHQHNVYVKYGEELLIFP